jgi:hypothetical protein
MPVLPHELLDLFLAGLDRRERIAALRGFMLASRALHHYAMPLLYEAITIGALNTLLVHPERVISVRNACLELPVKDPYYFDLDASDTGASEIGDLEDANTDGREMSAFASALDDAENGFPRHPVLALPDRFPSTAQIGLFHLDDALLLGLRGDSHVARAILLLHLLPSLRTLKLDHASPYVPFNALLPCLGVTNIERKGLAAGLRSLTSIRVRFAADAPHPRMDAEIILRMMALPSLLTLSTHGAQDSWNSRTEQVCVRAAYGTSAVQRLSCTGSLLGNAALENMLRLPRALVAFIYEMDAKDDDFPELVDLAVISQALLQHAETLEVLEISDLCAREVWHELVTNRLASLSTFSALRRVAVPASLFYTKTDISDPYNLCRDIDAPLVSFLPARLDYLELDRVWRAYDGDPDGTDDDPNENAAVEDFLRVITELQPVQLAVGEFHGARPVERLRMECQLAEVHLSVLGRLQRSPHLMFTREGPAQLTCEY